MPALIVHTAFLGDLCLTIPLMKKIKSEGVPLWLVCRKGVGSFFQQLGLIDQYFEISKGDSQSYGKALSQLKDVKFSEIYVPHESLRTAFLVGRLQADVKISYHSWWNFCFYDTRILRDLSKPEAVRLLGLYRKDQELLQEIADFKETYSDADQELPQVPEWASMSCKIPDLSPALEREIPREPFLCVFPGSVWETKKWTEDGFQKFCQSWKGPILLMGSQAERDLCLRIQAQSKNVQVMAGKLNLLETVQVLARAQVCLSNDSGGQHLAAVAGTPVVTIFGPTILKLGFRPWTKRSAVVQVENLPCRPCGKHGHQKCPLGTHDCMKKINPAQVQKMVLHLIS
ncbi:MAG: glycosyltransferase family 9 protein [Pseudobdellovibrionaceae bacterium]